MHRTARVLATAAMLLIPACSGPEPTAVVGNDDVFALTESTAMRERLQAQSSDGNDLASFTLDVNRQLTPKIVTYQLTASGAQNGIDLVVVRDDSDSTTRGLDGQWVQGPPDVRVPAAMQALLDAGVSRETLDRHFVLSDATPPTGRVASVYEGGLDAAAALFPTVTEAAIDASVDLCLDATGFVIRMEAVIVQADRTLHLSYDLVEVDGRLVSTATTTG